jgi:hypothetical protein
MAGGEDNVADAPDWESGWARRAITLAGGRRDGGSPGHRVARERW